MEYFACQNLLEFAERFTTDENCKEYLATIKWSEGFTERMIKSNKNYQTQIICN